MYKDGNSISIDKLIEIPTTERNGVEVFVELKSNYEATNFMNAIRRQLLYFENLFIIGNSTIVDSYKVKDFNELTIKEYNNFKVNSQSKDNISILIGKVKYPLRLDKLEKGYPSSVTQYPIALKFEIGDLEVTPNREEVLYSKKNIMKIQNVLDMALSEIEDLQDSIKDKDFDNLLEYEDFLENGIRLNLLDDISIPVKNELLNYTFKGQSFSITYLRRAISYAKGLSAFQKTHYLSYKKQLTVMPSNISVRSIVNELKPGKTIFANVADLKGVTKDYIRYSLEGGTDFLKIPSDIKPIVRKAYKSFVSQLSKSEYGSKIRYEKKYKVIFLYYLHAVKDKVSSYPLLTDKSVTKEYLEYRKTQYKKRANLKLEDEEIIVHKLRKTTNGYYSGESTTESTVIKPSLLAKKGLTIYSSKEEDFIHSLYKHMNVKCNFIKVADSKLKKFTDLHNFISVENFMAQKHRYIRKLVTALYIRSAFKQLEDVKYIRNLSEVSPKLVSVVNVLTEYADKNLQRFDRMDKKLQEDFLRLLFEQNIYDPIMMAYIKENEKYINGLNIISGFAVSCSMLTEKSIGLIVDYVLARKLFRLDIEVVKKYKPNYKQYEHSKI